ncbi:MAG: plasmid mobilization protein [Acutalibacteraceae bacterium]
MLRLQRLRRKRKNRCYDLNKRNRNIEMTFWVTEEEKNFIESKMKQFGSLNRSAYLRKIALDGYIINLNIPELKEIVSLLRYSSNNINQIAMKVNATGAVFQNEIEEIRKNQAALWNMLNRIIVKFSKIK